nr:MAG TPA: hypothetical protein [Caudoviricetes sp.]
MTVQLALRTGIPPAYWRAHPADMATAYRLLTETDDQE